MDIFTSTTAPIVSNVQADRIQLELPAIPEAQPTAPTPVAHYDLVEDTEHFAKTGVSRQVLLLRWTR